VPSPAGLAARFAATHRVTRLDQLVSAANPPARLAKLSHPGRPLTAWVWREQLAVLSPAIAGETA